MTSIVTWNIQYGKGCDDAVDLKRIARVTRAMGDADVICMQEVSRNDPDIAGGADQAAELHALFPEYQAFYGPGVDRLPADKAAKAGERRQFGNLLLSRLPVLQLFRHLLPHPPEAGIRHMQRQAIEAVVAAKSGPLRVTTTHLEYFSAQHRQLQIARLHELQDEVSGNVTHPPLAAKSPYDPVPRPVSLVLCGDLNLLPDDPEYRLLFESELVDAWHTAHPRKPHPHSTGLHDLEQWTMGGHCRDYFAVTRDVGQRIKSLEMDAVTDASDHQPLRLVLKD